MPLAGGKNASLGEMVRELARMEFIVAEHIKAHPRALAHPEKIADPKNREEIAKLTHLFARPADYFVRQ